LEEAKLSDVDLILNCDHTPTPSEIGSYIGGTAKELWLELNQYLDDRFKVKPKFAYSSCSGKPGWNLKYQKSGKALCTLYPEKGRFVVLVVVTLTFVENLHESGYANPIIWEVIEESRPFNKTKWLMIPVEDRAGLESTMELIDLKSK